MIYDHIVKFNGKYYDAGEEVPENEGPLSAPEKDEDIVFEADSVIGNKTSVRRGRPKKTEE